jgi:hypothetical protein
MGVFYFSKEQEEAGTVCLVDPLDMMDRRAICTSTIYVLFAKRTRAEKQRHTLIITAGMVTFCMCRSAQDAGMVVFMLLLPGVGSVLPSVAAQWTRKPKTGRWRDFVVTSGYVSQNGAETPSMEMSARAELGP